MKFKIGDNVKHKEYGIGKVVFIDFTCITYAVKFENFNERLHDLGLFGAPKIKKGHGLWCIEDELELVIDYKKLADCLLDNMCDTSGVTETITFLIEVGYTQEELLYLNFDEETIHNALEHEEDLF